MNEAWSSLRYGTSEVGQKREGAVVAGQYSEPAHTDQGTSDSIRLVGQILTLTFTSVISCEVGCNEVIADWEA